MLPLVVVSLPVRFRLAYLRSADLFPQPNQMCPGAGSQRIASVAGSPARRLSWMWNPGHPVPEANPARRCQPALDLVLARLQPSIVAAARC